MKCSGNIVIFKTPTTGIGTRFLTLEEFVEDKQIEREWPNSQLRKLLIALVKEGGWPNRFTLEANFGFDAKPYITISNPSFRGHPLKIEENETDLSVVDLRKRMKNHGRDLRKKIRENIEDWERWDGEVYEETESIDSGTAKEAIASVFPEAKNAANIWRSGDFYYCLLEEKGPRYVTRKVGEEFRGVVRLNQDMFSRWDAAREGGEAYQKHGLFWTALARTFVANELQIGESRLVPKNVFAGKKYEKCDQCPEGVDSYIVEKVEFLWKKEGLCLEALVIVRFSRDNSLPITAEVCVLPQKIPESV